jgi:hypothetical protein
LCMQKFLRNWWIFLIKYDLFVINFIHGWCRSPSILSLMALHWACEMGETWHWWRLAPVREWAKKDTHNTQHIEHREKKELDENESLWKNGCSCPIYRFEIFPPYFFFHHHKMLFYIMTFTYKDTTQCTFIYLPMNLSSTLSETYGSRSFLTLLLPK